MTLDTWSVRSYLALAPGTSLVVVAATATLPVLVLAKVLPEVARRLGVVGVVVGLVAVLLVVELVRLLGGLLLGTVLALLVADEVLALGLGEVVYASAREAGEHLLGEAVVDLLAFVIYQYGY